MSKPTDQLWEIVRVFDNYKSLKYVKGGCRAVFNKNHNNDNQVHVLLCAILQRNDTIKWFRNNIEEQYGVAQTVGI